MNGMRDEFLSGSGFTAYEDRRVRMRHLRNLFVHLAHGTGGADDVGEIVAFLQFFEEMRILIHQASALFIDEMFSLDGLRHHGGDKAQTSKLGVVVSVLLEPQINSERAHRLAFHDDRNAKIGDFLLLQVPFPGAVEKHRFAADFRHDDGLAGFNDTAGYAFAEPIARDPSRITQTRRHLYPDFR